MGDVMAKSGNGAVVIRAAPLPENIRETVNQHLRSCFPPVFKQQLLPCPFRFTVRVVQGCLGGRGDHDRARIPALLQRVQQQGSKTEIPLHEFRRVFRAVHPCQVEYKICTPAIFLQRCRIAVHVITQHVELLPGDGIVPCLAGSDIFQLRHEVPTDETIRAGHQYVHKDSLFGF